MSYNYEPQFGYPIADWYQSFAWYPVETVDRGCQWLRPVWKRRIQKHDYLNGGSELWWQYCVTRPTPSNPKENEK